MFIGKVVLIYISGYRPTSKIPSRHFLEDLLQLKNLFLVF